MQYGVVLVELIQIASTIPSERVRRWNVPGWEVDRKLVLYGSAAVFTDLPEGSPSPFTLAVPESPDMRRWSRQMVCRMHANVTAGLTRLLSSRSLHQTKLWVDRSSSVQIVISGRTEAKGARRDDRLRMVERSFMVHWYRVPETQIVPLVKEANVLYECREVVKVF